MENILIVKLIIVGVPVFVIISIMVMIWLQCKSDNKYDPNLWDDIRKWRGKKPGEPFSITDEELYAFIQYHKRR